MLFSVLKNSYVFFLKYFKSCFEGINIGREV